jgi:hypothetical protein
MKTKRMYADYSYEARNLVSCERPSSTKRLVTTAIFKHGSTINACVNFQIGSQLWFLINIFKKLDKSLVQIINYIVKLVFI